MKILIAVKRVIDHNVKVRVKPDGAGIETTNVKMTMNPFDEIAVEEALRLEEQGKATETVVVSVGVKESQETIRTALAMGANRGILVETQADPQPLTVAKLLKAIVERESPGLVLLGKQAVDNDCNQVGQMLAALLGWGQGTFACKVDLEGDCAKVKREIDGGTQTLALKLPAVITADLRLNEPRYVTLPNIMKAKKKPLTTLTPDTLGVDTTSGLKLLNVSEPPRRASGIRVGDAAELIDRLRNEARVI